MPGPWCGGCCCVSSWLGPVALLLLHMPVVGLLLLGALLMLLCHLLLPVTELRTRLWPSRVDGGHGRSVHDQHVCTQADGWQVDTHLGHILEDFSAVSSLFVSRAKLGSYSLTRLPCALPPLPLLQVLL